MKTAFALLISALLSACSNGPGTLEGTWQSQGPIPITITFRPDESETLGLIEKVSYEPQGQDVIVHYEDGLAKGTGVRFTVLDQNTIRGQLGEFRRLK